MDDEQILARGGTEEDIKNYADANGANHTPPVADWEERFDKKFGKDWEGNVYKLPDLHQPKVKSDNIKSFIRSILAAQAAKFREEKRKIRDQERFMRYTEAALEDIEKAKREAAREMIEGLDDDYCSTSCEGECFKPTKQGLIDKYLN